MACIALPRVRFEAGSGEHQHHVILMNYIRAGFAEHRADTLSQLVGYWCDENCRGLWRVEQTNSTIRVSFEQVRDRVLFQISEEFLYFEGNYVSLPCRDAA